MNTSTIRNQVENCTMEIPAESASAKLRQTTLSFEDKLTWGKLLSANMN